MSPWTAVATVLVLAGAPAAAGAAATAPTGERAAPALPTVQERVARALEYFEAGNFDQAIEEFQVAYAASASPALLLPWAQAERGRGNCREAIPLYERFIASRPPAQQFEAATTGLEECQARLRAADDAARTIVPGATGEAVAAGELLDPPVPGPEESPAPSGRPRPDVLGWSLVGIGAGVAIAGGRLFVGAIVSESRAIDAATYGEFRDLERTAIGERVAGGVVTAIGAALLFGGVIRLAVGARKRSRLRAWIGPGGGLSVGGRF